jgi:methylmalonyl-CoA carboxyltransferase 5S subunit
MPNSRLQMLLRGQNLLGYRHYEDSVVDRFVDKAAENGMDVFRVFDALNDLRNVAHSIKAVRRNGKHAQGTICYTVSPLHTVQGYRGHGAAWWTWAAIRCASRTWPRCCKPQPAYDIVKGIKDACGDDVRVHVHTHATTGVTLVSLMKAIEAGADCVDTAISSLSLGPGHNPTESLVEMLEGTGYTTRLDKERLRRIKDHFAKVRPQVRRVPVQHHRRRDRDLRQPDPRRHDLQHGKPAQAAGAGDRLKEVLEEVPRVRADAGFPPLVTPSSQIVGTQAVFNVMMGRYKA